MSGPIAQGREEWRTVKNRPSLSLERTADSSTLQMGFEPHSEETISLWHMSEASGQRNAASLLWPHCWFTHRDLLASFSICQHLLTTPEQGHCVADAPRRRRHLAIQRSAPAVARGCSIPLLRDVTQRIAQLPASQPMETSCAPNLSLYTPNYPSDAGHQDGTKRSGHTQEVTEDALALPNTSCDGYRIVYLSFTGGIFPCQELENRGPGYHLPRGLVNHPIFQLTALVCFGRSPS